MVAGAGFDRSAFNSVTSNESVRYNANTGTGNVKDFFQSPAGDLAGEVRYVRGVGFRPQVVSDEKRG